MANEPAKVVKTGEIVDQRPYQKFIQYLQDRAEVDSQYDVVAELESDQLDSILAVGDNIDDLFAAMEKQGLLGLRDLENGQLIVIKSWRFVKSNREDLSGDTGGYAIIDASDSDSGTDLALNTSIKRILGFLRMCEVRGWFPVTVKVSKLVTTSGKEMITLVKPRSKTVQSETA